MQADRPAANKIDENKPPSDRDTSVVGDGLGVTIRRNEQEREKQRGQQVTRRKSGDRWNPASGE
ncbi:MAG: hypothetical protein IPH00_16865 [Flavobacteriales bacterium]|nr:hypothetical protein [Flavobacteriales bacterium]